MARKIILFLVALVVPGGLAALVVAMVASWARKRYRQRTTYDATTNLSREDATIEAHSAHPTRGDETRSQPMFGSSIALAA